MIFLSKEQIMNKKTQPKIEKNPKALKSENMSPREKLYRELSENPTGYYDKLKEKMNIPDFDSLMDEFSAVGLTRTSRTDGAGNRRYNSSHSFAKMQIAAYLGLVDAKEKLQEIHSCLN